jgi:hypothetical protein
VVVVELRTRERRTPGLGWFAISALQLEHECSADYHSPQSGHGLSDRDGSHVRIDSRVDLVRAVCGRADPFGNRNGSAMRRRMS